MNTQQLQYLVEIERTRSISQAAKNLYIGQPNLSRILRDTESSLGFPIFERTRKGVRPTEKGVLILQHARNIIRELEFMEGLGPNSVQPGRFRVCLPRSYSFLEITEKYLTTLDMASGLDAYIRECHPRQALNALDNGSVEIAIIRYCEAYDDYFSEQFAARNLKVVMLSTTKYSLVTTKTCSLSQAEVLLESQLEGYTEITHRDTFFPSDKKDSLKKKIYTVDRCAQLQLLHTIPDSYLLCEPLPEEMLHTHQLVQKPCSDTSLIYQNALVFKPHCALSEIERTYIRWIREHGELYQR